MSLAKDFGKHLALVRQSRGLSQRRLAALSGLDASTINHLEHGTRAPSFASLEALGKALRCNVVVGFEGWRP